MCFLFFCCLVCFLLVFLLFGLGGKVFHDRFSMINGFDM